MTPNRVEGFSSRSSMGGGIRYVPKKLSSRGFASGDPFALMTISFFFNRRGYTGVLVGKAGLNCVREGKTVAFALDGDGGRSLEGIGDGGTRGLAPTRAYYEECQYDTVTNVEAYAYSCCGCLPKTRWIRRSPSSSREWASALNGLGRRLRNRFGCLAYQL